MGGMEWGEGQESVLERQLDGRVKISENERGSYSIATGGKMSPSCRWSGPASQGWVPFELKARWWLSPRNSADVRTCLCLVFTVTPYTQPPMLTGGQRCVVRAGRGRGADERLECRRWGVYGPL